VDAGSRETVVNAFVRLVPAALLCLAASSHDPIVQEDDPVYVDEIKKDFLDKFERNRAASDWKGVFDMLTQAANSKNVHKLVRLPGVEARYVGLIEHLNRKFVELPPEALVYYRGQFDGAAKREFNRAKAAGDREGLERVVDTWFYSTYTDEALDLLANLHVEEGRLAMAIHCWSRLLHHYPDSKIPRGVTAARLASAAAESGLDSILEGVRRYVKEKEVGGGVIVGDTPVNLEKYLAELKVEAPPAAPGSPVREPSILRPGGSEDGRLTAIRPEIRRWSAVLAETPQPGQRRGPVLAATDFPYLPAYGRIGDHEMVVYTNGTRITVIDPTRANAVRPEEGIYFTYPPPGETVAKPQNPMDFRGGGQVAWVRPYIGVTVDGEHAYATLYSAKRPREAPAPGVWGMPDTLFGMTRLVCLNLRTQQVMWDTDHGDPGTELRRLEFWERNFSFSGPPLVIGDRVYLGIGTSPLTEEESRVLCLDRRTGVPLWERFLASVSAGGRGFMGGGSLTSRLTVLAEDRGSLIAHSNIGVLASLDAVTGQVRWLSKYPRSNTGQNQWGQPQVYTRPASPLVVYRGRIYALPQDASDLLIADATTGILQKEVVKVEVALGAPPWRDFQRLVGRMGDYLVLGRAGGDSCILNTSTGTFLGLTSTNTSGMGRGSIEGETVYLPVVDQGRGGLGIVHGLKQWSAFERSIIWWPLGETGNVIRGGNYLIFTSSTRISILTDAELVRSEYRRRLEQSPPNPAAWLDYGMLMQGNDRWSEAARAYLNFIEAVQGDPEWIGRAREVRTDLHGIFLKRGTQSLQGRQPAEAAAHFRRARDFAWDGATMMEATRLLAGACENVAETHPVETERRLWARRAVEEYQELIRRSPAGFVKPGEPMFWVPIKRYASSRIAALVKKHGTDAYEGVARTASEDLKKAGKNAAALRALADLYPDSAASVEALDRLVEQSAAQGRWTSAASTLRDMRSRLADRWTPALQKRLNDALEKSGDAERLEMELARMERSYDGAARTGPEEAAPTVADYLVKAKAAAAGLPRRPAEAPPASTATLSTWEPAGDAKPGVGWSLIVPGGLEPSRWSADLEFFSRGSSVELWNIRTKKRVWTAPHPGGWTGIVFTEDSNNARGVFVTEVAPDSPAFRAGLVAGDVIRSVDGAPVSEEDFDLATEGRAPGTKLAVDYRRGEKTRRTDLTPVAWPESPRPGIIGAVFTAEGSLAVAWEDLVAAFDPADGRVRWVSRPGRDRFVIRAIHPAADRILVHEHFNQDRCRSSFRIPAREGAKAALPAEDQHSRVLALDESTGAPLYAVGLAFDAATAAHHSVQFLGRPLDSYAGLVVTGYRSNSRMSDILPLSVEDGKEGIRSQLTGSGGLLSAWIVEPSTGTVWVIDGAGQRQARLRSFPGPDYTRGVDVPIEAHVDPTATGYGLAAGHDKIAVVSMGRLVSPVRLALFSARDGSLIASHKQGEGPLKDRVMPAFTATQAERRLLAGLVTIEPDGMVILYNESKPGPGPATIRRASLSALSVAGGTFKMEWDAVTPTLTPSSLLDREFLTVRSGPKGYFVTTYRGIPPGKSEEGTIVAFHSRKDEGAVRKLYDDLVLTTDAFGNRRDPAPVRRGRIFLNRKGGLEILGD
jgi:outer membrane protein assembly factor BamB